jgi:hypothetical protein
MQPYEGKIEKMARETTRETTRGNRKSAKWDSQQVRVVWGDEGT